jgi:hypothetical protein
MKEYSRYMKSIGEVESPINQKSFNFYGIDVSLESLDEVAYSDMQTSNVTESIFEDVIRCSINHLWKSDYISVADIDITKFSYDKNLDSFMFECIATPKMCSFKSDKIKIVSQNICINNSTVKPNVLFEEYISKTSVVNDKVVQLDSFSKFYDSISE